MNGGPPPPDYLAQIHQTLSGGPAPTGPIMIGAPPAGPPPPPAMPVDLPGPNMSAMPPPGMSAAPPPAPAQVEPPPRAPAGTPFPLMQVRGAGVANIAAKETELRGPQLRGAQEARNEAMAGAVQAVNERNQQTAAADFALALEQERKAQIRQEAADYSAAERADEMAQRQQDFDQSVKALSQHSVDPGRFWANANAGQVIAALASTVMAGFVSGKTGRAGNVGLDAINGAIDRDIKAQEFSYHALRDTANAKQTAFSMAMQKYNNVDAARAAARAAALDATQAQIAKSSALWKGADAQNRAQMALAALEDEKVGQIAQGVAYTPAQRVAVGGVWVDPRTGLTYNEAQAREVSQEVRGQEFEKDKIGMNVAGDVLKAGATNAGKRDEKLDGETRAIAAQLQTAGVPQARAMAEQALQALNKSPGGKLEATSRGLIPSAGANMLNSEDANAREQRYWAFKNAAMKVIAGNVTASEEARMEKQFGMATDPESRRRAILDTLSTLESVEKGIKAGASPEAQHEYDRRRQAAEGAPAAAPKGSKAGW